MKKILLILLIVNISLKSILGQCAEGFIELKQQGKRDWVNTYDKLSKIYKSKKEPVSSLKSFFYDEKNKPKNCISFKDLQLLNTQTQQVFAQSKSDQAITDFIGAIKVAAERNKPGDKTVKPVVDSEANTSTAKNVAVLQNKPDSNTVSDASNEAKESLEETNANLERDNELLKTDKNLWRGLFLGSLVLSIALIGWLVWYYFPKQLRANEQSSNSFRQEQKAFYEGKIKELAGKIKDSESSSKNTFREPKPVAETPKTIVEKTPEPPKAIVPEPPKPQEKLKQFYLSSPVLSADGKGVFDGSETYNANSINSLYVFNLLNDTSAEFKFFNIPTTVQDAIRLPDRYLLYACEYSGVNSNATKIITTKAGKAVKEGNNWKITQKAEIRFE